MQELPSLAGNLRLAAERFPGRAALIAGPDTLTYAALLEHAAAVAALLRSMGIRSGERVALILANSPAFVAIYYGALMAGAIIVPLNAAAKAREIEVWLHDCEPDWIFAERGNHDVAAASSATARETHQVEIAGEALLLFAPPSARAAGGGQLQQPVMPDAPACIVYTSGTTGRPKGVTLSHANLAANTAAIVSYLQLDERDSIATALPFYYAYGSSILHSHIQAGGCLVLEKNLVYPHAVVESLAAHRCTGFAGVPSTFALLLSRVKLQDYDLSALRYITQAGGAMSVALTERLRAAVPHAAVIPMYGQTEATARLTFLPAAHFQRKAGSVGIAIPGVSIEIRDEHGGALPAGATGEVWARGPNVMLGYWRNETATQQVKRDGWLLTGDLGWLDAEGFLFLAGRRSDMIKAGAHRVHPLEVEEVIAELPQVQEVAVVGIDDELLGQAIKAFVVPAAAATLTPLQVQAHCRARLANYKIPKMVEFVAGLPRTASGKIRRAELMQRDPS